MRDLREPIQAYARSLPDAPELADITAVEANGQAAMDIDGGAVSKGKKRKRIYEDHRPMSSITAGIKQGTLHQVCSNLAVVNHEQRRCSIGVAPQTQCLHGCKPLSSHVMTAEGVGASSPFMLGFCVSISLRGAARATRG